ncbi:MAG: hypothetical protein IPK80_34565 [Nannocystis sp.]|nr:hypothetical protein [Nannocystis sp.]
MATPSQTAAEAPDLPLIEEDLRLARLTSRYLSGREILATHVSDGLEALAEARRHPYDVSDHAGRGAAGRVRGAAFMALVAAAHALGCYVDNPLYTASEAEVSASAAGSSGEASASGTGTGGTGTGGTGTGGTGTGGTGTGASGTGGTDGTSTGAATDGGETTGGLACLQGMTEVLYPLAPPMENGLVVSPNSIEPCAWPTPDDVPIASCDDYNLYDLAGPGGYDYGSFDLAADPERGTAYYLIRFDSGQLKVALQDLPSEPLGYRFSLTIYEGIPAAEPDALEVLAITDADAGWLMSESTFKRARAGSAWSGGDLASSLVPLTALDTLVASDQPTHFELTSPIFVIPDQDALVEMGLSLAVRHEDPYPRPYNKGTYMVEALDNVEWNGAGLWAVVCAGP